MRPLFPVIAAAITLAAAAPAPAPEWIVDKSASRVGFKVTVEGRPVGGVFKAWDARIRFDPKRLAASQVTATIQTASAVTGDRDRDDMLPSQEWFAVKAFPAAVFTASRFVDQGGGRYQAIGDLNLKGVHKPVVLPFTLAISGDAAKMTGSLLLDRTAFNVGSGRWKSPEEVGVKVNVLVSITARRAPIRAH